MSAPLALVLDKHRHLASDVNSMCDDIIGALFLAQLQGPVSTLGFWHFAARQRASRAFVVFDWIAGGRHDLCL